MTKTTVYKNDNRQYMTTIPKAIAEGINIEAGDMLDWGVVSKTPDTNDPDVLEIKVEPKGDNNE